MKRIDEEIERRRKDTEFMARLDRMVLDNRGVLDRLAHTSSVMEEHLEDDALAFWKTISGEQKK